MKKTNFWKTLVVVVSVIVFGGAVSSLLHDRRGEKEEKTEQAREDILMSELEVGMDLSGYKIEVAVTEEEYSAWYTEIGGGPMANYMMFGDARLEFAFDSVTYHKNFTEDVTDSIFVYYIMDESYPAVQTPFVLPSGSVITDLETLSEASMGTQFKFVYVGVASPASYNLPKREVSKEEQQAEAPAREQETEDFGFVGNELPDDSELWSRIY